MWPPPRSGRDGAPPAELEAPLLNPSKYPADLDSVSDDCFLDDINTQVGVVSNVERRWLFVVLFDTE